MNPYEEYVKRADTSLYRSFVPKWAKEERLERIVPLKELAKFEDEGAGRSVLSRLFRRRTGEN